MGIKRILIVEDAIDLGRLLQDALKTSFPGVPITVVPSAEEAILESSRFTIDLLISDIRLPGMTGFDLVRKIRSRQPGVKVMMISGLSIDDRLRQQLDDLKPDAFMHKPMGMPEFLELTGKLLGVTPDYSLAPSLDTKVGKATSPSINWPTTAAKKAPERPASAEVPTKPRDSGKRRSDRPAGEEEGLAEAVPASFLPEGLRPPSELSSQGGAASAPTPPSDASLADLFTDVPVKAASPQDAVFLSAFLAAGSSEPAAEKPVEAAPVAGVTARPAQPPTSAIKEQPAGLTEILIGLRSSLAALAVILLDDRGHPVAQAGDLPDEKLMAALCPAVLTSLSTGARISYLLGEQHSSAAQVFRGKELDLAIAPVGQFSMMIVLRAGKSSVRAAIAVDDLLTACHETAAALKEMGINIQTAAEVGAVGTVPLEDTDKSQPAEAALPVSSAQNVAKDLLADIFAIEAKRKESDQELINLEQALAGNEHGRSGVNADSFWESAAESKGQEPNPPDVLTYEQAQKLGLLPDSGK